MNILIKLMGFNGGAPRSLFEYAKVLIEHGNKVYVVGAHGKTSIEQLYSDLGVKVIYVDSYTNAYKNKDILGTFKSSRLLEKIIKDYDIELIIPVGVVEVYFTSFVAEKTNCRVVGVIPGGKINTDEVSKLMENEWRVNSIICFSKENKDGLMQNGVPEQNITIVANRIDLLPDNNWTEFYKFNNTKIKCFLASRFAENKINGIITTINIVREIANQNTSIELNIAGDGPFKEEIQKYSDSVNKELGAEVIKLIGFVSNPESEYLKSHVVFGKGRGIIEPLILRRLVVVVGEDNKFDLCTKDTFGYLFEGNFGGRNIKDSITTCDLKNAVNDIANNKIFINEINEMFKKAYDEYHVIKLYDRIIPIIMNSKISKKRRLTVFRGILMCFAALFSTKFKKIFH